MDLIDYDDCATHWYVADIEYALRDAGELNVHSPNIQKFIEGYRQQTPLNDNLLTVAEGFFGCTGW